MAWAINLINQLGPSAPKDQIVVPKDHKDVISELLKLKRALDDQKVQANNRLPSLYKQLSLECIDS